VLKLEIENGEANEVYHFDRAELSPSAETYEGIDGISYGDIEGLNLNRLSGNERRIFTIRPKRQISHAEAYDLRRVLNRIKPADCRFLIDSVGAPLYVQQDIAAAYADSGYWEVISRVVPAPLAINPYQTESLGEPVEQPRPPFSRYQGEAWSYVSKLAGATASFRNTLNGNQYEAM